MEQLEEWLADNFRKYKHLYNSFNLHYENNKVGFIQHF